MTVIGTNIAALRATNASNAASTMQQTAMERLSTGKRINSAKDDAAGLAISSRMASAVKSMNVAVRNANDGISLAQTAEGSLGEVTNMLQRMKELATQSASGTLKDTDRVTMQSELGQLTSEIANVAKTTNFNGVNLLDGSTKSIKLQTGIDAADSISLSMVNTSTGALGLTAKSVGATVPVAGLSAGDLIINGQAVGATTGAGDAKNVAAAINAVSTASGVTAAATNSVSAKVGTVTTGSVLKINGTNVTMTSAEKSASAVAAKINSTLSTVANNNIKASTDSSGNLVLTASDGGNITVKDDTTNAMLSNGKDSVGNAAVLDGSAANAGTVAVEAAPGTPLTIAGATPGNAGLSAVNVTPVSISTQDGASAAMAVIDSALDAVSAGRGDLGVVQNRLTSTVNTLTTTSTNLSAAQSRIEDADFSTESTNLAKAQILSQASVAMLSQANQSQQGVLKLLQ